MTAKKMTSAEVSFDTKPFDEMIKSAGFSRMRSFKLPIVDGVPERVHRAQEVVFDSIEQDPTLVMYIDDPATILFFDRMCKIFTVTPLSPLALARRHARDPSSVDRSDVLFIYDADGDTRFVKLRKSNAQCLGWFADLLTRRGGHGDTCVVCYATCDIVAACKRCNATMCSGCNLKNTILCRGVCPICRDTTPTLASLSESSSVRT